MDRSSFLFPIAQAKRIDREILHAIGVNGEELGLRKGKLFSESYANEHYYREMLTQEATDALDKKLVRLLRDLAVNFLDRSTHKVYEFLIRYYRVNDNHAELIAHSLLPYHDTKIYARMCQILRLPTTTWIARFSKKG
jgi:U3 small nucleolar RNA-associated protein 10